MTKVQMCALMRKALTGIMAATALLSASCGSNNSADAEKRVSELEAERDSLATDNRQMAEFMTAISASMDTIVMQQGAILHLQTNEKAMSKRDRMKQNLQTYADILKRQRERIAELEKSLADAKGDQAEKMRVIIASMQKQIDEKDALIAQLRKEINTKNTNIEELTTKVSELDKNVAELSAANTAQEEALVTQSDMMNEAFVKIGTKKELEQAGILGGGGFLRKKKLDISSFKADKFRKIDIRETTSFELKAKKPKVLTPMPESSYTITKNSDGSCTLNIKDATAFWSVSNYLVVQL